MPANVYASSRRRKSSARSVDLSFTNPVSPSQSCKAKTPSASRRSSQYSDHTASTPTSPSVLYSELGDGYEGGESSAMTGNGGLGNLADELAGAMDGTHDDENTTSDNGDRLLSDGAYEYGRSSSKMWCPQDLVSPMAESASVMSLSPPKQSIRSHHQRHDSRYDGSDYGDETDMNTVEGISPSLETKLAAIESLARRGTEANGSDLDTVIQRMADSLKDLPSQSNMENGASRLITTHAALTSHLSNQTRTFTTLTHPLISPLSIPPDNDVIDDLIPMLLALSSTIPSSTSPCLGALHSLRASTIDLQSTLTYLSDTIYMTRQTMISGGRKLRTATDLVVEMRREAELRDEAVRWLEKGEWARKLEERSCAKICSDVVGGFELFCDGWRQRLVSEIGAG